MKLPPTQLCRLSAWRLYSCAREVGRRGGGIWSPWQPTTTTAMNLSLMEAVFGESLYFTQWATEETQQEDDKIYLQVHQCSTSWAQIARYSSIVWPVQYMIVQPWQYNSMVCTWYVQCTCAYKRLQPHSSVETVGWQLEWVSRHVCTYLATSGSICACLTTMLSWQRLANRAWQVTTPAPVNYVAKKLQVWTVPARHVLMNTIAATMATKNHCHREREWIRLRKSIPWSAHANRL